jgi:hypothetical protein
VWAEVLSRPEPGVAICGMGLRDVAMDQGLPRPLAVYRNGHRLGELPGRLNDQHGFLATAPGPDLEIGDVVEFGVSHPCTCLDRKAGIEGQTRDVLGKVEALLAAAGTDKSRLLSVAVYLPAIGDFAAMNAVYDRWIDPKQPPARVCTEARLADPDLRIEVTAIAAL